MKIPVPALVAGAFVLLAAQIFGQETGTSHPEALNDVITTAPARPAMMVATQQTTAPSAPVLHERQADAVAALPATTVAVATHPVLGPPPSDPADAGIVTTFPYSPTALLEGTMLKARLAAPLSTKTTKVGTESCAQLSQAVEHDGKVVLPVGAIVSGRVTAVRGGHRIGGAAAIHIEPEVVTLPDGTFYNISAQVIDLDQTHNAHVNSEGTIVRSDHGKATMAALTLTTSSTAAAGAMIAGVPGAVVGAGVGAGIGAIWWLKQDHQQTLPEGTQIIFTLSRPMGLTPAHI